MIQQSHSSFQLNCVAVGPQRTGTTWLYQALAIHPQICFPKGVKETMFFDQHYKKGLPWYEAHFRHCKDQQICGEIAPTYFNVEAIPKRIYKLNPQCRIIINLRHPLERILSVYRHYISLGMVKSNFDEAVKRYPHIINAGHYSNYIPHWLNQFGRQQIYFILLEDIQFRPNYVLENLEQFLEIAHIPLDNLSNEKINATTLPKFPLLAKGFTQIAHFLRENRLHGIVEFGKGLGLRKVYTGGEENMPNLTKEQQSYLLELYEPDTVYVENLLGQSLPRWREINN
jgi:hypothetical protein